LSSIGNDVVVIDNFVNSKPGLLAPGIKLYQGDCGNMALIKSILKDDAIDCVVHLADYNDVNESNRLPLKYYTNNSMGMMFLLQAVVDENVKKFIFASSAQVYGQVSEYAIGEETVTNPINVYGETKLFCECVLRSVARQAGINYAIFRHFDVAGSPTTSDIFSSKNDIEIFGTDYNTVDGTRERDYLHVEDAVEPYALVLPLLSTSEFYETYNISTGRSTSMRDMVNIVSKVTGHEVHGLVRDKNIFEPARLVSEPRKAQAELGWHLKHTDLEEIIRSGLGVGK
jgi:UDP-glucose 4-epimerase